MLFGYVVAQIGYFKSLRGQFTAESLRRIVSLMRGNDQRDGGTPVYFTHDIGADGERAGTFLGRARDARLDKDRVRADLHFSPAAFLDSPYGRLGEYVATLVEHDHKAQFIEHLAWHPDGQRIVTGCYDFNLHWWNVAAAREMAQDAASKVQNAASTVADAAGGMAKGNPQ